MILLLASACTSPVESPVAAREACGFADGRIELDSTCIEHLGRDLGMDWNSFEGQPEFVSEHDWPRPVATPLLGLAGLLREDFGTIDDFLTLAPPIYRAGLSAVAADLQHGDAGGMLYAFVTRSVEQTWRWDDMAGPLGFDDQLRTLFVRSTPSDAWPLWAAGEMLVHEAAHAANVPHVACDDGDVACDDNANGAYGLQAAVTWMWATHNGGAEACVEARALVAHHCARMLDSAFATVCEEPLDC